VVGETKIEQALAKAVTKAEKQTAKELDVDPKDVDRIMRETVDEM